MEEVVTPSALPSNRSSDMRAILDSQRAAFLRQGAPTLDERSADLMKLRDAVKRGAGKLADAISADFGNRSRHETELAVVPGSGGNSPYLAASRRMRPSASAWVGHFVARVSYPTT
jgi:coniferyl-aldehyde dehydrogenase